MNEFDPQLLKQLYVPASDSHKGQNGKLLIIAGSTLFHAASIWPLTVASRLLDMVFYASVPENNEIVQKSKEDFRNGIVITRDNLDSYIKEAECILIGPGLERTPEKMTPTEDYDIKDFAELKEIEHPGIQTYYLTKHLLKNYKDKRYVIDGGALQMMDLNWLLDLKETPIMTPHQGEYQTLFGQEQIPGMAKKYNCVILSKGEVDKVVSSTKSVSIFGGNAGMTKGGTGDVLAGLVASLYCKNDAFLSACAGSYINKKAAEALSKKVGLYFNASDLANEIPIILAKLLNSNKLK